MAKEYIERDAALMGVMRAGCMANTVQVLKDIPAADVVEVVRCKDCKNYGDEHFCPLLSLADYTDPDDFCSYGEKRDDDAAD